MTACTHSTVIEDARNSQPKRINATSSILSQRHTAESRIDVYYIYMKGVCACPCGRYLLALHSEPFYSLTCSWKCSH